MIDEEVYPEYQNSAGRGLMTLGEYLEAGDNYDRDILRRLKQMRRECPVESEREI